MSLLNAWVTPSEAIVAVDTDGVARDGSRKSMSKLLTIPHLNVVIGFRGQGAFLASMFYSCISRGFDSFDELLDEMPAILEHTALRLPAGLQVGGYGDIGNELIAVGWSHREETMIGRTFAKRGEQLEFSARASEGCIAPWDAASMSEIPKKPHAVERLARAQVEWMRANHGFGGGTLIFCRVTREAIFTNHLLRIDEEAACQP